MSDRSGIEWTDATWNPVTGCTKVSPGCDHCYAETFAERWRGTPGHYYENGFDLRLRPEKLDQPLRWRRPRRIFVNSMSDLFHDQVPDKYIAKVFAVMALAPKHTYQVLTKRHARMRSLLNDRHFYAAVYEALQAPWTDELLRVNEDRLIDAMDWCGHLGKPGLPRPLTNVWLGVSAENQQWADIRVPALLDTPAAVRFVSAEPLLGPIYLKSDWLPVICGNCDCEFGCNPPAVGLDWVIVGGESGRTARPMHPQWARDIRDQCASANVAFLFKQAGSVLAGEWGCTGKGTDPTEWPEPFPREYPNVS